MLVRGKAYGITNFVSRPFGALATILVEYTKNPMIYVVVFSAASTFSLQMINEINDEDKQGNEGDDYFKSGED